MLRDEYTTAEWLKHQPWVLFPSLSDAYASFIGVEMEAEGMPGPRPSWHQAQADLAQSCPSSVYPAVDALSSLFFLLEVITCAFTCLRTTPALLIRLLLSLETQL